MVPGGGGWIRTNVGARQRIYSPPPLATRAPLPGREAGTRAKSPRMSTRASRRREDPFISPQPPFKVPSAARGTHLVRCPNRPLDPSPACVEAPRMQATVVVQVRNDLRITRFFDSMPHRFWNRMAPHERGSAWANRG
jgi:hypothetical protein